MDWNQLFPILNQKFNSARCMERLYSIYESDHWISFDRRPETADYCARTMAEAGLEQIEQLPLQADGKTLYGDWKLPKAWKVDHATLHYADGTLICDYHQKPCCLTMYSPSTPGPVEAEVVDIAGLSEAPADSSLRGKVLFTNKPAAAVLSLARQAGAAGILTDSVRLFPGIRNSREDLYDECPWEALDQKDLSNTVFSFKLTPRQGDRLRAQLCQGPVRIVADVKTEFYDGTCPTVSGALIGTDPDAPEVLTYGHLYEPGANDNASGAAALLELAQCIQEAIAEGLLPQPKRTIRFVMGYECRGSMGYLCAHPEQSRLCGGIFDMIGTEAIDHATLSVQYNPMANWSFADAAIRASVRLYEEFRGQTQTFNYMHFYKDLLTDNIIADPDFHVPSIAMVAFPALSYHSSMDTPQRIEPEILKRNALILGVYLFGPANADQDTCVFLHREILDLAQQERSTAAHPRKQQHITEATQRALYSLRRIDPQLPHEKPAEAVPPMPDYAAQVGPRIPVRLVPGCLTLNAHPELKNPRFRPSWNAPLNVPLFWADGERNLWQIAYQTACELGECTDEQIRNQFEMLTDYFDFLSELGYMTWK